MLADLAAFTDLAPSVLLLALGTVLLAGAVRGFTGFALSAITMAVLTVTIAPVDLIPICYFMEAAASIALFRGGLRHADMRLVTALAIGSMTGMPVGLAITTSIPPETSKVLALCAVAVLTLLQLAGFMPRILFTGPGRYVAGFVAGIASGLAMVGGMLIALYVLSTKRAPHEMRASIVVFLFFNMFASAIYFTAFGIFDAQVMRRSAVLVPVALLGVLAGAQAFRPQLTPLYRRFCLILLLFLSSLGLFRLVA